MDIPTLRAQHAEIEVLAKELLAVVSDERRRSVGPLRWRLARALIAHLAIEDRFLYPRLIGGSDSAVADVARRFQAEMGGLAARFTGYMSFWTDDEVIADWPAFCRETRDILAVLLSRIAREDEHLYGATELQKPGPSRLAS